MGESAGIKLFNKDNILFGDEVINTHGLYENQWQPLVENVDLEERIKTCALYDPQCGGGAIGHFNIGEPITDFDKAWDLANKIAQMGVIYYSLIHKFSYCKEDHSFYGETCPVCGNERLGYGIKIVGYIVKDENFHSVRKKELNDRVFY